MHSAVSFPLPVGGERVRVRGKVAKHRLNPPRPSSALRYTRATSPRWRGEDFAKTVRQKEYNHD
jgi:hypothetical protein